MRHQAAVLVPPPALAGRGLAQLDPTQTRAPAQAAERGFTPIKGPDDMGTRNAAPAPGGGACDTDGSPPGDRRVVTIFGNVRHRVLVYGTGTVARAARPKTLGFDLADIARFHVSAVPIRNFQKVIGTVTGVVIPLDSRSTGERR